MGTAPVPDLHDAVRRRLGRSGTGSRPGDLRWDDYPFIFLTLMLSLQASYAAPLILLAQNRQEVRDRVINEQDRQANARAHADMEFLAREVASLRMALGEVATRDFLRSELRNLLEELDERATTRVTRITRTPRPRRTAEPRTLEAMTSPALDAGSGCARDASTTPRSSARSPTSAWSSTSTSTTPARSRVTVLLTVVRLPDEGHHHPRRDRGGRPASPASPASTSTLGVMTDEQRSGAAGDAARRPGRSGRSRSPSPAR